MGFATQMALVNKAEYLTSQRNDCGPAFDCPVVTWTFALVWSANSRETPVRIIGLVNVWLSLPVMCSLCKARSWFKGAPVLWTAAQGSTGNGIVFLSGVLELYDETYREQQNHVFTLGWVIDHRCHCEWCLSFLVNMTVGLFKVHSVQDWLTNVNWLGFHANGCFTF